MCAEWHIVFGVYPIELENPANDVTKLTSCEWGQWSRQDASGTTELSRSAFKQTGMAASIAAKAQGSSHSKQEQHHKAKELSAAIP